jgi:hypothetical protein
MIGAIGFEGRLDHGAVGAVTNLAALYLQCGDNAERLAIVDTAKFVVAQPKWFYRESLSTS